MKHQGSVLGLGHNSVSVIHHIVIPQFEPKKNASERYRSLKTHLVKIQGFKLSNILEIHLVSIKLQCYIW